MLKMNQEAEIVIVLINKNSFSSSELPLHFLIKREYDAEIVIRPTSKGLKVIVAQWNKEAYLWLKVKQQIKTSFEAF